MTNEIEATKVYRVLCEHLLGALAHKLKGMQEKEEYYGFITLTLEKFVQQLLFVKKRYSPGKGLRFLDVGCGIGHTLIVASALGFASHGLEYDSEILEHSLLPVLSKSCRKTRRDAILPIDALKFDRYGEFDVVFLYCPIKDYQLEGVLERTIESELKVGAIYICNLKRDRSIEEDPRFERIHDNEPIWQKVR